jgi:hypothetical protein
VCQHLDGPRGQEQLDVEGHETPQSVGTDPVHVSAAGLAHDISRMFALLPSVISMDQEIYDV